MLKRIHKNQVRNGMFIEDFVGSWQENPIARRRFVIRDDREIDALKLSRIGGVVINTALGLDVDAPAAAGTEKIAKSRSAAIAVANDPVERRKTIQNLKQSVVSLKGIFSATDEGVTARSMAPLADQVTRTMQGNPLVLLNITRLKSKDEVTFLHSIAVSALMVRLA